MTKSDYLIIIKGLLWAKNTQQASPQEIQKLIDYFDNLWQEAE
jgi:hypothetical protein